MSTFDTESVETHGGFVSMKECNLPHVNQNQIGVEYSSLPKLPAKKKRPTKRRKKGPIRQLQSLDRSHLHVH